MKLVSFLVTIKFGDDSPVVVDMPPNEAMMLLSLSSLCDSVIRLVPNFEKDEHELSAMSKKEN